MRRVRLHTNFTGRPPDADGYAGSGRAPRTDDGRARRGARPDKRAPSILFAPPRAAQGSGGGRPVGQTPRRAGDFGLVVGGGLPGAAS